MSKNKNKPFFDGYNNFFYLFLPFRLPPSPNRTATAEDFRKKIEARHILTAITPGTGYLFRYVTNKISGESKYKQYSGYKLSPADFDQFGIFSDGKYYFSGNQTGADYALLLDEIQISIFRTSIGILAFRLTLTGVREQNQTQFRPPEASDLGDATYELKKVARCGISHTDSSLKTKETTSTFLSLSEGILDNLMQKTVCKAEHLFFFYCEERTTRANVMLLLESQETEQLENERKNLYYLRNCYWRGYQYNRRIDDEQEALFSTSADTMWGITSEAAVCMICPNIGNKEFLRNTFPRNFQTHYLFMYQMLLHQKYALYMFLSDISPDTTDLKELENYRTDLLSFESDFVYSIVSEVPQYQKLYEKIRKAFQISEMFTDVHEPLIALEEERRRQEEKRQQKNEEKSNRALTILSLLGIFSALVDCYDFFTNVEKINQGQWWQIFSRWTGIALVAGTAIYLLITLLNKNRKN